MEDEADRFAPEALQDWYRYIDSLARPPRRPEAEIDDADFNLEIGEAEPEPIEDEDDTELAEAASPSEEGTSRRPPYMSWGEPWTPPPPAAPELDDQDAEQIVAQLAPETPPTPPRVEWEPSVPDVPVPELTQFISTLDEPSPRSEAAHDLFSDFRTPADSSPWPQRRPEAVTPSSAPTPPPTVTTTALVRVTSVEEVEEPRRRPTGSHKLGGLRGTPDPRPPSGWCPPAAGSAPDPRAGVGPSAGASPPSPPIMGGAAGAGSGTDTDAGSPTALPSIGEIRQRLPQHMERLLQVPTSEVAQHSYKCPFKESREDLIQRLLDPPLTLEDAARLLGVCPTTVRRYTNRGLLRHYRTVGNQRRFRLSDVLSFLDEHGGTWRLSDAPYDGEDLDEEEDRLAPPPPTRH